VPRKLVRELYPSLSFFDIDQSKVYIMLGTVDNVRALSGWPTVDEVPDSEIEDALASTTRKIVTMTGIEEASWDLVPTNANKPIAEETCEVCTAAMISLRVATIDKALERTTQLRTICNESMTTLKQSLSMTEADDPAFLDVDAAYTTWPLNEFVDPYDPNL
jgi:hypothetical protein